MSITLSDLGNSQVELHLLSPVHSTTLARVSWTLTMSERQRHTVNMSASATLVQRSHDAGRASTTSE